MTEPVVLSARDTQNFALDGALYQIKPATLLERAWFRRDVAAAGARFVTDAEIAAECRSTIERVAPDNAEDLLARLDAATAPTATGDGRRAARAAIDVIADALGPYSPRIAVLLANRDMWFEIAPLMAARRFLIGAAGGAPWPRGPDGLLEEATLAALPPGHIQAIGLHAILLLSPSDTARKN